MKKQLFALALITLLVGCIGNHQKEVSYDEFVYRTKPKATLRIPTTATLKRNYTITVKNLEAFGYVGPSKQTFKDDYLVTFNEDASSYTFTPALSIVFQIHAISTETALEFISSDEFSTRFYINPMKVFVSYITYSTAPEYKVTYDKWSFTYNNECWVKTIEWTFKTKMTSSDGSATAEVIETGTINLTYNYAE